MSRHVLVLGGHGKVAQLLTPMLLRKSWTVTSIIRHEDQVSTVEKLGSGQPGKLRVLVRSIEDVKSPAAAQSILDEVRPDSVVWSAGAAGRGGAERTFAIDRDAAKHFIAAAESTPSITRFILISYLNSRRAKPSWWSDEDWKRSQEANSGGMANYFAAKVAADEALFEAGRRREGGFAAVSLRPGRLTLDPAGPVELGRTKHSMGSVSRASVAEVTSLLLEAEGLKSCWLDLLEGQEDPAAAVKRVVKEVVDCAEGEPVAQVPTEGVSKA